MPMFHTLSHAHVCGTIRQPARQSDTHEPSASSFSHRADGTNMNGEIRRHFVGDCTQQLLGFETADLQPLKRSGDNALEGSTLTRRLNCSMVCLLLCFCQSVVDFPDCGLACHPECSWSPSFKEVPATHTKPYFPRMVAHKQTSITGWNSGRP